MKYRGLIFVVIAPVLLLSCKDIQIESRWIDRTISFTGKTAEWNDLFVYQQEQKADIAVMNDDAYLYVCFVSWDPVTTAQIMHLGLTASFESKSGKGKTLGIHYPIGMGRSGLRHGMENDTDLQREKLREALEHIELIGPNKQDTCPSRTIISESMGILTRIVATKENCIYEIKVPLTIDSVKKFAIGVGNDDAVLLKLETSPHNPETMKNENGQSAGSYGSGMEGRGAGGGMGGRGSGGGMHGGHGAGRGHGGGGGGRGGDWSAAPFSQSFTITLSRKPGAR